MLKAEIRTQSLKKRLAITDQEYKVLNEGLLRQFCALDFSKVNSLHTFLPIRAKKEPDTFLLIEWMAENYPHIKIIVPKADFETALMTNHEYVGLTDLKESEYNIPEPQKGKIHQVEIDLVLIPLLAFDRRGYRVGYGKGFYDRLLENTNAQKIGLSLLEAIDKIDDVNSFDIRLDVCLTPTQIIKF